MNCFNGERFIEEAIKSVLAQTFVDWELVIWDNNSQDRSREIVSVYTDRRIIYVKSHEHVSLGEARYEALKLVRGDWFCFLDVDDIWKPEKLEVQMGIALNNEKVGLVYSRYEVFGDGVQSRKQTGSNVFPRIRKLPSANAASTLCLGNFINITTSLMRSSGLGDFEYLKLLSFAPDYWLNLHFALKTHIVGIDQCLAGYRVHSGSLSFSTREKGYVEMIGIIEYFQDRPGFGITTNAAYARLVVFLLRINKFKSAISMARRYGCIQLLLGLCQAISFYFKFNRPIVLGVHGPVSKKCLKRFQ